jgi:hypothetical protein
MSDGSFEVQFLHTGEDDVAQHLLGLLRCKMFNPSGTGTSGESGRDLY